MQSVIQLAPLMRRYGIKYDYDPGALSVTIRKFYRPGGASTQRKGVVPGIVLPSLTDNPEFGEGAMKNPLPWDSVPPAKFSEVDRVQPYLETLQSKSAARVQGNSGFAALEKAIALIKKREAETTVSLNEATRKAEKKKTQADEDQWDKQMAKQLEGAPTEYEITVKNADQPGLPTPVDKSAKHDQTTSKDESDSADTSNTATLAGDLILQETQRILVDYLHLLTKGSPPTTITVAR